jgi:predicted metal-dependent hydrolase
MKHQMCLDDRTIDYTVKKNSQAKHLRISVRRNGEVLVTIPKRAARRAAVAFVEERADWIATRIDAMQQLTPARSAQEHRDEFLEQKAAAKKLVLERLAHFNENYRFVFGRVTIKNHTTKWGSCSSRGNLNFNYKIISLPTEVADYIIVHELCHLREMNHSPQFWLLVSQSIPDYPAQRKHLRHIEKHLL